VEPHVTFQPRASAPVIPERWRTGSSTLRGRLRSDWYLVLLLAICLGRMWVMPLPSSFWLDEAATVMLAQHPDDASFNVAPQLSATIYNSLPRAVHLMVGDSEIDYRLPSLILAALALWIIGRIAARLIAPEAAWFAVFACLAIEDFDFFAIDVRPYALGIFVVSASIWMLVRWLDSGKWLDAAFFALFAGLLWRVHLAYWTFYPVYLIYALVRLAQRERRATWIQGIAVFAAVGVSLIPVAFDALALFHNAGTHIVAPVTSGRYFVTTLAWKQIAGAFAGALAAGILCRRQHADRPAATALALVALWWLGMPLLLFGMARLSGTGIFLARYSSPALPGAALAATAAAAMFLPRGLWKPAGAVFALVALAMAGRWEAVWPVHAKYEDLRSMASLADFAAAKPDTPVLVLSGFVEAVRPNWTPDYKVPGFLYCQLYVYPVQGRIFSLPFSTGPEDEAYLKHLTTETLSVGDRFVLYGVGRNASLWVNYLRKLPELAGWQMTYKTKGELLVAVFDRFGLSGIDDEAF